jgi:NAD(P)-dependent dehydrogenase (short-subunit alcohol dehydrogenase family)
MTIAGKVVVVTGAGSGIGQALAVGFVADGAQVIGFERNAAGLDETQRMCGGSIVAVVGDVTSETDVQRLVATALERFGRIDVLFNNAGIAHLGRLLERPFADWAAVVEVNLIGLARCTYHVLPHMLERGHGRIVNVSSRGAESGLPEYSAYSASKAGVNLFTKALAREVLSEGYRDVLINAIIPGVTTTPLGEGRARHIGQEPAAVYPHARFVADLPENGPTGRIFYRSEDYDAYQRFNEPTESGLEPSASATSRSQS